MGLKEKVVAGNQVIDRSGVQANDGVGEPVGVTEAVVESVKDAARLDIRGPEVDLAPYRIQ